MISLKKRALIILPIIAILSYLFSTNNLFFSATNGIFSTKKVVHALEEQFVLDLNLKYEITEKYEVFVTKKIDIINLENELSVTSFTQNLEDYNYYDLVVKDSIGQVVVKEIDEDNTKRIVVPLRNSKIGKNHVNTITIQYKSKDLLQRIGTISYFNLPKIPKKNVRNLNIEISTPKSLGKLIYVTPSIPETIEKEKLNTYLYKNNSALDQAISATFGEYQVVNFSIKYELSNDSNWFVNKEVALIPDIKKRQEVAIRELNPKPTEINIDKDGNYLAKYRLNPKSKIEITYQGSVRIYGPQLDVSSGGKFEDISEETVTEYTKENQFWESKSIEIKDIANTLKDSNLSVILNAKKIYEFLTENYKYNYEIEKNSQVERYGALKALTREAQMGCMEFSDSFIAIARSMGIPAREINGYAISENSETEPVNIDLGGSDILHSWVEFYDPNNSWVGIDPTWGATSKIDYFTKTDLSRVIFVIKGIESTYPLPAGMYKNEDKKKQVDIVFPKEFSNELFEIKYQASNNFSFNFINLITNKLPIKVKNIGNTSIYVDNESILPFEEKIVYFEKTETAEYQNFLGTRYELKVQNSIFYYLLVIVYISFLGLLMYVILYILITQSKFLRKLFALPFRHPRGRGR
jgi:transglutaminase-like putative cysteine protease